MSLTPKDAIFNTMESGCEHFDVPRFLVDSDSLKLSSAAVILYTLLLAQYRNTWKDEQGRAYALYEVQPMAQFMGVPEKEVAQAMNELKGAGLIIEENKTEKHPNRCYLLKPQAS